MDIQFRQSYSATYRDPPPWRLQKCYVLWRRDCAKDRQTNRRRELPNDETQSQHQPDKTQFEAQVVYSKVKRLVKDCFPESDERSLSLVDAMYSSGEPLVTKQRIGEDTKICCENASETYEDIRIFPSLATCHTILPCPGSSLACHDWNITCL